MSDPKALQYILEASGYRFPKSLDTTRQLAAFFGYGLVAAIGTWLNRFIVRLPFTVLLKTKTINDSVKS